MVARKHVCRHDGMRPITEHARAIAATTMELGDGPVHHCPHCDGLVWGPHRHVLQQDHGAPHLALCDGCGAVLGTRQLPKGRDPSEPTGLVCPACPPCVVASPWLAGHTCRC